MSPLGWVGGLHWSSMAFASGMGTTDMIEGALGTKTIQTRKRRERVFLLVWYKWLYPFLQLKKILGLKRLKKLFLCYGQKFVNLFYSEFYYFEMQGNSCGQMTTEASRDNRNIVKLGQQYKGTVSIPINVLSSWCNDGLSTPQEPLKTNMTYNYSSQ